MIFFWRMCFSSWTAPPPPFPLCLLTCGFMPLPHFFVFFTLLPACTHVSTALVIGSRLPSVFVSGPVALPGAWPLAVPGQARWAHLPRVTLLSSLYSLPYPPRFACLPPALLLLLSWSVCSLLLIPTLGLYLARSSVL